MRQRATDPYLVLIAASASEDGSETPRRRFVLPEGRTTVGRSRESDIRLSDRTVSRSHCVLERRGRDVTVSEVSGKNRTWVGDDAVDGSRRPLNHGDILRIGRCRLAFHGERRVRANAAPPPRFDRESLLRRTRRRSNRTPAIVGVLGVVSLGIIVWALITSNDSSSPDTAPEPGEEKLELAGRPVESKRVESLVPVTARTSEADATGDLVPAIYSRRDEDEASVDPVSEREHEAGASTAPSAGRSEDPEDEDARADVVTVSQPPSRLTYYDSHVVPYLRKYCTACHGAKRQKGDLSLESWPGVEQALAARETWESIALKIRKREMPPPGKRQPDPSENAALLAWIEREVLKVDLAGLKDPGRVTMRRLSNYEYNYTIRDLTGVESHPADDFPDDDIGYGFDNIGDVLSIPPLLMEKYLSAAESVAREMMSRGETRQRVLICQPRSRSKTHVRSCATKILTSFATRAYRRPVKSTEIARLLKLVDLAMKNGGEFQDGIELAVQAVLASPHFLFRVELDSQPNNPKVVRQVNDWELAARLSYFLWSSLPDSELIGLAQKGRLRDSSVLETQVRRMIDDPKSRGMIKTFGALWLGSRAMKTASPDPTTYSDFDEELRSAMRKETELFFEEIMRKDLSILLFLDADFTFLNERLAKHYGVSGVRGDELRRVALRGGRRGGVLTQGTMLTVTSNPTRTSPVMRGKWILEQVLGTPPPPPPPGVDSFEDAQDGAEDLTLRQVMEKHRRDPNCAVCHTKMDALGLALENFDGVGAWRDRVGSNPIDPSGVLPDGRKFRDAVELKAILLEQKDEFCRCLTEKMLTFALGRGLEYADTPVVEEISRSVRQQNYRFSALVLAIVRSEPFQKRRGESVDP